MTQIYQDLKNGIDELSNENVVVQYKPNANETFMIFSLRDLKDEYNLTTGYNKGKRGHKEAFKAVHQKFSEDITFWQVVNILDTMGMKIHTYCAMD